MSQVEAVEQTYTEKLSILRQDFRDSVRQVIPYFEGFARSTGLKVKVNAKEKSFFEGENGIFKVKFMDPDKLCFSTLYSSSITIDDNPHYLKYQRGNHAGNHCASFYEATTEILEGISQVLPDEQLAKAAEFIKNNPLNKALANG